MAYRLTSEAAENVLSVVSASGCSLSPAQAYGFFDAVLKLGSRGRRLTQAIGGVLEAASFTLSDADRATLAWLKSNSLLAEEPNGGALSLDVERTRAAVIQELCSQNPEQRRAWEGLRGIEDLAVLEGGLKRVLAGRRERVFRAPGGAKGESAQAREAQQHVQKELDAARGEALAACRQLDSLLKDLHGITNNAADFYKSLDGASCILFSDVSRFLEAQAQCATRAEALRRTALGPSPGEAHQSCAGSHPPPGAAIASQPLAGPGTRDPENSGKGPAGISSPCAQGVEKPNPLKELDRKAMLKVVTMLQLLERREHLKASLASVKDGASSFARREPLSGVSKTEVRQLQGHVEATRRQVHSLVLTMTEQEALGTVQGEDELALRSLNRDLHNARQALGVQRSVLARNKLVHSVVDTERMTLQRLTDILKVLEETLDEHFSPVQFRIDSCRSSQENVRPPLKPLSSNAAANVNAGGPRGTSTASPSEAFPCLEAERSVKALLELKRAIRAQESDAEAAASSCMHMVQQAEALLVSTGLQECNVRSSLPELAPALDSARSAATMLGTKVAELEQEWASRSGPGSGSRVAQAMAHRQALVSTFSRGSNYGTWEGERFVD